MASTPSETLVLEQPSSDPPRTATPLRIYDGAVKLWTANMKSLSSTGMGNAVAASYCNEYDFIKSILISPDGSTIASVTDANTITTTPIPSELIRQHLFYPQSFADTTIPLASVSDASNGSSFLAGDAVYDLKWYPGMNISTDESTNCFAFTSRDHPIHLWNVKSGLVCSYSGINHLDELDTAISLSFNLTGDKIYAGSNRTIRCFDIATPGKKCVQELRTSKTKKSLLGQKGLISTLSFNPDYSGAYAAGSYAKSVSIYVENGNESVLDLIGLDFDVSCLKWSPCGRYLWIGGRNCSDITCWDLRSSRCEVGRVERLLTTNQRMSFDIDPFGTTLCTGTEDGQIRFYDTNSFELMKTVLVPGAPVDEKTEKSCPKRTTGAVPTTCINSVQYHPYAAMICTALGERQFASINDDDDEDDDDKEEKEEGEEKTKTSKGDRDIDVDSCGETNHVQKRARQSGYGNVKDNNNNNNNNNYYYCRDQDTHNNIDNGNGTGTGTGDDDGDGGDRTTTDGACCSELSLWSLSKNELYFSQREALIHQTCNVSGSDV